MNGNVSFSYGLDFGGSGLPSLSSSFMFHCRVIVSPWRFRCPVLTTWYWRYEVESECLNRFWSVKFGSLVMAMGVSSWNLLSMRWCWPCCSRILRSSLEKMTEDSLAKSNLGQTWDPMTIQWTNNNDQRNQFQDFKLSLDCAPASSVLYGKQGPGQRWAQSFGGLALAGWQADLPGYWPEPRLNKKSPS